jgi:hypothetical protein
VDIATVAESAARLSGTTVELLHAFALAEIQIKYQNRTGIQWLQTQYTGSIDPPPYSPRGPSDLGESSRPPPSLSLSLSLPDSDDSAPYSPRGPDSDASAPSYSPPRPPLSLSLSLPLSLHIAYVSSPDYMHSSVLCPVKIGWSAVCRSECRTCHVHQMLSIVTAVVTGRNVVITRPIMTCNTLVMS